MVSRNTGQEMKLRLATEIAELWPPHGEWTEADYFALPDTNRLVELSEGELIMPPHPTETHQRVLDELYAAMRAFVREHNLGIIRFAPLPVRLWPGKIREPDILFIAQAHADRIGEQVYGPPDLVVEVLSSGTRRTDRGEKFLEYARAGVSEYWLVDPDAQTIEVFTLEEGVYTLLGKFGPGETARSQLLAGFEVAVDEVFAAPRSE
ncbi:MAG: Uma2 family endonuclease [Anaerolineae bacterium]|nr:Uma2 family endonuclease [Anaerolineae bacterium]